MIEDDPFLYIADQEARVIQTGRQRISALEGRIHLVKAILNVKVSPGWTEYVKQVELLRARLIEQVLDQGSDKREYLAGTCAALTMILRIIAEADKDLERSEKQLAEIIQKSKAWTSEGRILPQSPI